MIKKFLVGVAIISIVVLGVFLSIMCISSWRYIWLSILVTMLLGMYLAAIFLKEDPIDFYENFAEWKRAKVSSFFVIGSWISVIGFIIESIKSYIVP